jgi:uncharacterized membrane protein
VLVSFGLLLELSAAEVVQGGVHSRSVVPEQSVEDCILSFSVGFELLAVQPFDLQRTEQRLRAGVVPAVAFSRSSSDRPRGNGNMSASWAHLGTSIVASFLASLVEGVEALTVILAVGSVRGWRSALAGSFAALIILLAAILLFGRELMRIPLHNIQLVVGILLVMFGLRWLRKAILRSASLIPLHDEEAIFARNTSAMQTASGLPIAWDKSGFAACFHIVMLEGTEVVFIVIAIGAGGAGMLLPAGLGAFAALLVVSGLGLVLHRPLARVPENTLKFIVGILLSAFGTFWIGEGMNLGWPASDWAIVGLIAGYLTVAAMAVQVCRRISCSAATVLQEK